MSPETETFLERIGSSQLFGRCGQRIGSDQVIQVLSWDEALDRCESLRWERFLTDRHNELASKLPFEGELLDKLDTFVIHTKSRLEVDLKCQIAGHPLTEAAGRVVCEWSEWILLRAAEELEFHEVYGTRYHLTLSEWLLRGHFPCGWMETGQKTDNQAERT